MPVAPVDLFADLDRHVGRIPLNELRNWLESVEVTFADVLPFLRFHPEHYVRNLMHNGPAYQALVLCWRSGQRSPIHDHKGSSCAVRVLHGQALETIFDFAPNGMIYPLSSRELPPGYITASQDRDIHQMSNLQRDSADLVTLHIYSPPLFCMNTYSLLDGSITDFFDPVNDEFAGGAGI